MSWEGKYGRKYLQGSEVLLPQGLELLADFVPDISFTCKRRERRISEQDLCLGSLGCSLGGGWGARTQ